jgi:hypothetical protein
VFEQQKQIGRFDMYQNLELSEPETLEIHNAYQRLYINKLVNDKGAGNHRLVNFPSFALEK